MLRKSWISQAPTLRIAAIVVILFAGAGMTTPADAARDLVLVGGRVMDPETQLDAVRNVVIEDGRITAITTERPSGGTTIDVSGLVVAPGFIDLHAHGQDMVSNRFQAADGVTTSMDLEIGMFPVKAWYESRKGEALINYGVTVSHVAARYAALEGGDRSDLIAFNEAAFGCDSAREPATDQEVDGILTLLEEGLREGALGVGFGITYTPGSTHREIFRAFRMAAGQGAPVFVHMRSSALMGGDRLAPIQEVLANAAATGASLHIVHINSSTDESARAAIELIRAAREGGLDVTTESYPYTAGSTLIESALFDNWNSDYSLLQWAATGERLTAETYKHYREQGGMVIIHGRSEETSEWLVRQSDIIVASDGISFRNGPAHPRGAGTYSKILGYYVRERKALDLMTALRKMTLMPARRLESIAPQMKRKGRVQVGADADLTIFDPGTVRDKATYTDSMQFAVGIRQVLVGGELVVRDGELVEGVAPGQPIYGSAGKPTARTR
jgi:dihydroorotase